MERQLEEVKIQLKQLDHNELQNPKVTFEQTKNALLGAHFAQHEYLSSDDYKKQELLEILLLNIAIADKKVQSYQFKPKFQLVSELPKNAVLNTWLRNVDGIRTYFYASTYFPVITME